MRLSHFFSVFGTAFLIVGPAFADDALTSDAVEANDVTASASGDSAEGLAWDQFDDPEFDPATAPSVLEAGAVEEAVAISAADSSGIELAENGVSEATSSGVVLGPKGTDDQGRSGRLHTVARGDTLWDLSAAYLGTPWVWPSVWTDNDDIANPHMISPGDKIWITANEMRVVTDAEAESFLAPVVSDEAVAMATELPAAPEPMAEVPPLAALEDIADDPSTLDAFPVAIPGQEPNSMPAGRQVTIARRDAMGFVSADDLAAASTVVASPSERTFLSFGDRVYLGLGEGDVEVGDQFTAFGVVEEVRDVETNRLLGHHVENFGWIEVLELTGDTSIGEIRQSFSEMRRGALIVPRKKLSRRVTVRTTPDAIEGQVSFLPADRTLMADGGYVYLNRGEFHGVEVGSELEVFQSGEILNERERRVDVRTPDKGLATLVVVSVEPESSVAFVLTADREIAVGDYVRPVIDRRMAQR